MEDAADEIRAHTWPESPPSVRITVTVASAAPANRNSLALALPIQRSGGISGREDCWSEEATAVLIGAWGERFMELSRGNLKQKHWQEVADIVRSRVDSMKPPKTDVQCKNRIDTVKKKYKTEKSKVSGGSGPSCWPFYNRLDRLIGPNANMAASKAGAVPVGIPVGVRTLPLHMSHYSPFMQHHQQQIMQSNYQKLNNTTSNNNSNNNHEHVRRGPPIPPQYSDSEADEEWSRDSDDSLPPETPFERRKRPRVEINEEKGKRGDSIRELTRAILKFGKAYESAESAKLRQIVEMEKQRMEFAKEMELQRIKFLMKTQLEISQLNGNTNHHNNLNHANSDSSN